MRTTRSLKGSLTIATVVAVAWVLVLVVVLASGLEQETRALVSQVAIMATAFVSSLLCWWRARRSAGRRRQAWSLFAAAGFVGLFGNALAALTDTAGLDDVVLLIALLTGIAALLSFPTRALRRAELVRAILDGIVVGGSVLFVSALVVFPELGFGVGSDGLDIGRVASLSLPIVDAVLATLAVLLILRSVGSDRTPLALVGISFTMYAVADLAYAVVDSTSGFQFGTLADLGWVVGYALGGVAACHPAGSGGSCGDDDGEVREGSPVVGTVVTFALFIGAAVFQVQGSLAQVPTLAVSLWFLVITAVAARQIALVAANERLRRTLEKRVIERTAELAAATHTTELTLSSVGEGIYGVDRNGVVTFVNPAGARTLGYWAEDLVGVHAHDHLHAFRDDDTPFPYEGCYISEAITKGVTVNSEEDVYRRADGKAVPVEVTASPVLDDGEVTGAVVVFRDVAQRREVERLKNEFIAVISHELRTPLTSIKGSIGLVEGGATGVISPEARRLLAIAGSSVDRLTRLINDILEVERLSSGSDPLNLVDVRVDELVRIAVEQIETLAAQAGVTVDVRDAPGTVRADADRIVQTLVNLLGNAVKFTESGGHITVSGTTTGTFAEIAVADTGRGIPAGQLEAIFGRFEQVDSSDAREKGGTGLGLAISRGIVGRHGGRIWAESSPGVGSTFRFTLPTADAASDSSSQTREFHVRSR
ncbi:hypothetical protein C8046_13645 [Serinibacter arcticus]|uniref:histidine kinase n=1 Tax=Serinibacter arcticus TaxID=1655435 RepID=A0A2U1ZX54_9MICO|nr:ATP-binding protein [Serinibacter arcticus]PWD51544.1 hypothetical protein C8046_13645 [Serinibacter arcticus]